MTKEEALKYLNDTDWYIIRYHETGVAVPEEVLLKRKQARIDASMEN